jgi:hypothetical protein
MIQSELPTFEATWWPLMMETVPGSGERLTIAAVVRAASGQTQVRQLITPDAINKMFGTAGSGMKLVVAHTSLSIQQQLDRGLPFEDLSFPFGGFVFGGARDCLAQDLNEVFEVAFKLGGAFGLSQFGAAEKPSDETRRAFDEWAEKVRAELLVSSDAQFQDAFNVSVPLLANRKTRIGFLRGGYAANFGVLRPGVPAGSDVRALKIKIFDLEALRHNSPLVSRRTELLVGYPEVRQDSGFSRRELETQRDSWDFISFEAKQRGVIPLQYSLASQAANYLLKEAA